MRPKTRNIKTLLLMIFLALPGALAGAARAATLTVTSTSDSGPGSLRQALAAAQSGDTITFAPGVTDIALTGGQLTDAGVSIVGPGVTLDAGGHSRVLEVSGGTSASPVTLGGLTLKNGSAGSTGIGGGARVDQNAYVALTACALTGDSAGFGGGLENGAAATVTLTGCTLTQNSATYGGGLFNYGGTLTLTGCTLTQNSATYGGGLDNGGTATLTGCTFTQNSAPGGLGGGLENSAGTLTLTGCTLAQNSAPNGGGIENGGTLTLTQCALTGDSATYGGGLENGAAATATVTQCALTGDSAVSEGGGLINGGTLTLTGCALTQNSAGQGGGLFNLGPLTLTGCTLAQNSAGQGGGLYNSGGTVTLTDDILYGDTATQGGPEVFPHGGTVTAAYSDIGEALGAGGDGVTDGGHDFDADPLFVGAPGDLHLKAGSPAAGRGAAAAGNTTDLDGRPRAAPPSIGAYEAAPAGAYSLVVENTADALPLSLRAAVQCADDYPDAAVTFDPKVFTSRLTIVETRGALSLTQPMTITGPAPGVAVDGAGKNSVFTVSGGTSQSPVALAGLTIQDGSSSNGAGLANGGTATLTGCTLAGNSSPGGAGGGLFNTGALTATGCTVAGNTGSGGGGLANFGTATLAACAITGNSSPSDVGGGLFNTGALTATGCTVAGNSAGQGGGLDNDGGTATLTDDILYGNSSPSGPQVSEFSGTVRASYCDIGEILGTGGDGVIDNGHNLGADPQFVGAGTAPYAVQPGSPVVGAGIFQSNNVQDITGKTRANPPTIGAYEGQKFQTSTGLMSSLNPSALGQTVTFTATVADTTPGGPAPAGSVTFTDFSTSPATALGTVTLVGGLAQIKTAALGAGAHGLVAAYNPAAGFTASLGGLSQTVLALPAASAQSVGVAFGTAKAVTLTGSDPNSPPRSLTYSVATGPSHGTLTGLNAGTGAVTYTPAAGYHGADSFTFTASNGPGTSSPATVSLNVASPTISGTVTLSGWLGTGEKTPALTFTLTPAGGTSGGTTQTLTPTATGTAGAFTFTLAGVAPGSYTLGVKGAIWLREDATVSVTTASAAGVSVTLPPGDVSGDNVVDGNDTALLRLYFNTVSGRAGFSANADLNGDGVVDGNDTALLRAHFNAVGRPY